MCNSQMQTTALLYLNVLNNHKLTVTAHSYETEKTLPKMDLFPTRIQFNCSRSPAHIVATPVTCPVKTLNTGYYISDILGQKQLN